MTDGFRDDLADIHDAGFGGLARAAGPVLVAGLQRWGCAGGLVVELGFGSGIVSRVVAEAGYDVLGIDLSPAMIALARERVPSGSFRVGSVISTEIPRCIAVAAIGEVFNYLFDAENNATTLAALLRRTHAALAPGGLLLFDVAGPGRVPGRGPRRILAEGDDWAVLATLEEDTTSRILTRSITSFRQVGELFRRAREVHRQRLIPPTEVAEELRAIGYRVRVVRGYGSERFPVGLAGFLASQPNPSRSGRRAAEPGGIDEAAGLG
jgi:SAM-dependent methyltransferase